MLRKFYFFKQQYQFRNRNVCNYIDYLIIDSEYVATSSQPTTDVSLFSNFGRLFSNVKTLSIKDTISVNNISPFIKKWFEFVDNKNGYNRYLLKDLYIPYSVII